MNKDVYVLSGFIILSICVDSEHIISRQAYMKQIRNSPDKDEKYGTTIRSSPLDADNLPSNVSVS